MPELPEVQTIVGQLKEKLVGKTVTGVQVRLAKVFHGDPKDVIGAKITDVSRRAKIIIVKLSNGKYIVVHLKMAGQLVYGAINEANKSSNSNKSNKPRYTAETISFSQGIPFAGFSLPAKTTHAVFDLDDGSKLFFNDMRQFGWVKIINGEELKTQIEKLGPEPLSKDFTLEYFTKICSNWGRPIKLLLMEQGKIAGIGNIYANEALWCAQISPMHRGRDLVKDHPEKVAKLHACIREVLETGLKYGGSSAADEAFVNALGEKGKMQEHFNVYQKDGQPCPRSDRGVIRRATIGGRGTFFCPRCQR